jgi:hypothetical protein
MYNTYDSCKFAVRSELCKYESLDGPYETYTATSSGCQTIFDPLVWWGKNSRQFPLIYKLAQQTFVIPASSAESERNFSTAGKIARRDRARFSNSTVEASVLVAQAIKKKLIDVD